MPPPLPKAAGPWWPGAVAGGAAVAGLALFRWYEQELAFFLPACQFHELTGLFCPGCGATRAVRALLHGDVAAAWNFNQLFVAALPVAAVFFAYLFFSRRPFRGSGPLAFSLLGVMLLFGVARNIPLAPFNLLAPH